MYGEIITIGNELVSGRTIDLNSWYAAGRLTAGGLRVDRITSVGDDPVKASRALKSALENALFIIITGGLGSTEDDITIEIVAEVLRRPLCKDEEMARLIQTYVDKRGLQMSPSLEKMTWMPEGSKMLNPRGNACGFSLIEDEVRLYFLPGVPDQMRYLMDKIVLPELLAHFEPLPVLRQRLFKLYGINEPEIADRLEGLSERYGDIILGFYPNFPENHITISLRGKNETDIAGELKRIEKEIYHLLGPYIFAMGNQRMEDVVGEMLRERCLKISVAESCTGGLIGNLLTNIPGSSHYFQGGVMVYSNESKCDLLNVSPETLKRYGAVSDQTVREMAHGIKNLMGTDMGLAVTGIAGPEGGTKNKPVGTVHIGLAGNEHVHSGKYRFWGTRQQIKMNTAMMALDWVRKYLNGDSFFPGL
jgi:nicotinamide-nucleotide amidase